MRDSVKNWLWAGVFAALLLMFGLTACRPARADENPWSREIATAALHPAGIGARPRNRGVRVRAVAAPLDLHPALRVASAYLGRRNPTGTRGPWCRDFVNHTLRAAGYRVADNSRRARDAVRLGPRVSDPRPGDLVVMRGHVTFFAGYGGRGVLGLGGNQSGGRVSVSSYPASRVIAFIRPGA